MGVELALEGLLPAELHQQVYRTVMLNALLTVQLPDRRRKKEEEKREKKTKLNKCSFS